MKTTGNLKFKKPEGTDLVDIEDLNANMDILDVEVVKLASATEPGRMSAADKVKLNGIAASANNYVHPATHPATMITEDAAHRFATDAEKTAWNAKASTAAASSSAAGLMSAADKAKLDGVAAGANNYTHPSTHPATLITEDATHRFATDAEKAAWNAKETTSGAQSKADAAVQPIYNRLNNESSTAITLNAGQQVVSVTKNSRLQKLTAEGKTLIDLTGGAFDGDSLKYSVYGSGVSISTAQKKRGNSSIKTTSSGVTTYAYKDITTALDKSKYYIVAGWAYIESYTSGNNWLALCDVNTFTLRYSVQPIAAKIGEWQFVVLKVPTNHSLVGSGCRVIAGVTGPATVYYDDIRLYAISATDYAAIGTTVTGAAVDELLPYVPSGINGVDGLYVQRYGRNLYEGGITGLGGTASYFEHGANSITVTSDAVAFRCANTKKYPVLPNSEYTLSYNATNVTGVDAPVISIRKGSDGTGISSGVTGTGTKTLMFNTGSETEIILYIYGSYNTAAVQVKRYENIQLEIGSTASPFQLREDSLLAFSGVELHANPTDGSEPDVLREVSGSYEVRRLWRETPLDGTLAWEFLSTSIGYKTVRLPKFNTSYLSTALINGFATKYDGKPLVNTNAAVLSAGADVFRQLSADPYFYVNVATVDSGWGDAYTPSAAEVQGYFNGWIMGYDNAGTFATPYNGTGAKRWRAMVGDLSGGVSTMPTIMAGGNYVPYQLLYRLTVPVTETVQPEGSLSLLEGDNFIEVGSGYVSRERANPVSASGSTYINSAFAGFEQTRLKNKAADILEVFKDGLLDQSWYKNTTDTYGLMRAISTSFDPAASYSTSYIKLDKSPVPSVNGIYATTEKAQLHDLIDGVTEALARVSVVEAKKAEKDSPMWIEPTLLNGWMNFGGANAGVAYKKIGGLVFVRGVIKDGSTIADSTILILPEGYRPAYRSIYVCYANGDVLASVWINALGEMSVNKITSNAAIAISIVFEAV